MNKENFIRELKNKIKKLPKEEVINIIAYYEDYFADADKSEEEVIKELGNPSTIASQILSDYAFNDDFIKDKKDTGKNKVLLIILAILAAPMALPLAITVLALLFAMVVVIFAVAISFAAIAIAFGFSGVILLIAGMAVLLQGPSTGILCMGLGIIFIGLGILAFEGMRVLLPKVKLFIKWIIRSFLDKANRRGRN